MSFENEIKHPNATWVLPCGTKNIQKIRKKLKKILDENSEKNFQHKTKQFTTELHFISEYYYFGSHTHGITFPLVYLYYYVFWKNT